MNPVPLAIISTFIFASILLIVTGAWNNFMFRLLKSSQIFKNEILKNNQNSLKKISARLSSLFSCFHY